MTGSMETLLMMLHILMCMRMMCRNEVMWHTIEIIQGFDDDLCILKNHTLSIQPERGKKSEIVSQNISENKTSQYEIFECQTLWIHLRK